MNVSTSTVTELHSHAVVIEKEGLQNMVFSNLCTITTWSRKDVILYADSKLQNPDATDGSGETAKDSSDEYVADMVLCRINEGCRSNYFVRWSVYSGKGGTVQPAEEIFSFSRPYLKPGIMVSSP